MNSTETLLKKLPEEISTEVLRFLAGPHVTGTITLQVHESGVKSVQLNQVLTVKKSKPAQWPPTGVKAVRSDR